MKEVFFYEPIILPEEGFLARCSLTLHPLEDGGWLEVHGAQPSIRRP